MKRARNSWQIVVNAREDAPAAIRVFGIVGGVLGVLVETDWIWDFDGHRPDFRVDLERGENGCELAIKIRDRARHKKNRLDLIAARRDSEHVIDEVKFHREDSEGVRNGQGRQAARADVERFGPAVVHARAEREGHLAHHLRPHMERGAGVLPFGKRQSGPGLVLR